MVARGRAASWMKVPRLLPPKTRGTFSISLERPRLAPRWGTEIGLSMSSHWGRFASGNKQQSTTLNRH
ncbi:hypothetical protein A6X20_38620 [Bradyrhizobium elkanii]|nr:hypothetical protein A6X20_38620 [Bradyrhizobium elkanii]